MLCRSRPIKISVLLFSLLSVGFFATANSQELKPTRVEAKEDVNAWCVDQSSGRIFAALGGSKKIIEYSQAAKVVRSIPVINTPQYMLIKKNRLVIACGPDVVNRNNEPKQDSPKCSVAVIDLATNKILDEIQIPGIAIGNLFCSREDNSYVGGIVDVSELQPDLYQIDLDTVHIRSRITLKYWLQDPSNIAMSADGRHIVPDERGRHSGNNAGLVKADEEWFSFNQLRNVRHRPPTKSRRMSDVERVEPINAGPVSRYWFIGKYLYDEGFKRILTKYSGEQGAKVHPAYELVVSSNGKSIFFESFPDGEAIDSSVAVESRPNSGMSRATGFIKNHPKVDLFFDDESRLYHCFGRTCNIFDITSVISKAKPLFLLSVPTAVNATAGSKLEIPISISNKNLNQGTTFKLAGGPDNSKLEGDVLHWQVGPNQTGQNGFVIEAVNGQLKTSARFSVAVAAPSIKVNFNIKGLQVDSLGERAIIWGPELRGPNNSSSVTGPHEVCVIDIKSAKKLAQRQVPNIRSAVVDDKYVYLSLFNKRLMRLDRDTLNYPEMLSLDEVVNSFCSVPSGGICLPSGHAMRGFKVLDREKFTAVRKGSGIEKRSILYLPDGLVRFHNTVADLKTGETVAQLGDPGFPKMVASSKPEPRNSSSPNGLQWGRWINSKGIHSATGELIHPIPHFQSIDGLVGVQVGRRQPLLYTVKEQFRDQRRPTQIKTTWVESRRLLDGKLIDTQHIGTTYGLDWRISQSLRGKMDVTDTHLIAARGDKVIINALPKISADSAKVPLYLPIPRAPFLDAEKKQEVSFKAKGGTGKLQYSLETEDPNIEIDPESGKLTINTPVLWEQRVVPMFKNIARARAVGNRPAQPPVRNPNLPPPPPLPPVVKQPTPEDLFQQIYGKPIPAGKFPVSLPVSVVVTDSEGQFDKLKLFLTVIGPNDELVKLVKEQTARIAAQKKAAAGANDSTSASNMNNNKSSGRKFPTSTERIEALESRVKTMSSKLDAIAELLKELKNDK